MASSSSLEVLAWLLELVWLRESKSNLVGGELVVAVHDGIKLSFHSILVQWVEHDLLVFLSIKRQSPFWVALKS